MRTSCKIHVSINGAEGNGHPLRHLTRALPKPCLCNALALNFAVMVLQGDRLMLTYDFHAVSPRESIT